jgi:DNA-binding transcriptional ArsR family regulator
MMLSTSAFAETAALIGDPARANMLAALMDGRALTARELADAAGITPQTASGHLSRMVEAGLLAMERQGRHRYHRLASPAVAQLLESIMSVAAGNAEASKTATVVGPKDRAMRRARTCYDHLAGEVAVAITDRMIARGHLEISGDGAALTDTGHDFFSRLGVDVAEASARAAKRGGGRVFCRPCLDWSERRPHIAGAFGRAFCSFCFDQDWVRRIDGTRALMITPHGQQELNATFDLTKP